MKKSQISVQFHWIFIAIAGIIILGFFIGIALKQKALSEKRLAGEIKEELNQIFSGAGVSEGTSIKIDIPNIRIEFSCVEEVSIFSISETGVSRDTAYDIIFAPDLVKGKSLVTWALAWKMPFNIQNFLMVTSPSVRYILVYGDGNRDLAFEIIDELPDALTKEMHSAEDIENIANKNNYRNRFIFLQAEPKLPSNFEDLKDEEVSAVRIMPTYAQFYKKKGNTFSSAYPEDSAGIIIKDPTMYGALFAGDIEMYKCNIAKAYSRLKYAAGIYQARVIRLKKDHEDIEALYAGVPLAICNSAFYTPNIFNNLIEGAQNQDINQIEGSAEEIREKNDILLNAGCPLIY